MIKFTLAMLRITVVLATVYLMLPTFAFKKTSNEFMEANQKTRMWRNYVLQRALQNYITNMLRTNPEVLPALIMDYANMRDDINLLDDPVETRTRKRGNVQIENYDEGEYKDVPCRCEQESKDAKLLGEDYFPPAIETRNCDVRLCPSPYGCKERFHNVTVLKRKRYMGEPSQEELPEDLNKRWIAIKEPVIVGCMCLKEY